MWTKIRSGRMDLGIRRFLNFMYSYPQAEKAEMVGITSMLKEDLSIYDN